MSFTRFWQKKIVDHILGIAPYTAPATLYLSLHTASPTEDGLFASEVSTVGTGYARQIITAKMAATDSTTGISLNNATIAFPVILTPYGTVTYIGINDALTGGNMGMYGAISEPQSKSTGEAYQFTSGQLSLALD